MADINESKESIEGEVLGIIDLERQVQQAEAELMKVPEFVQFVQLQKKVKRESDLLWETVQNAMEANRVKKIAGDWGSITLAERISWDVDLNELSPKYIKKVANLKKITSDFQLKGDAPKGTAPKYTKYLLKRIK